ncbi:peroxide stress protein YaaA [Brumimicrobium mesophilum]|uniref:peroxide stress protein YaaA n=1 Tax=Brumimicrobium mesophilum TaxID=392717 RepID=UPI000D13F48F|nr:peroxide stress protein YaaA [Brumimicrobium mesophilum]
MKILLSPAKSLDYNQEIEVPFTGKSHFIENADYLAKKLQKMSKKKLGKLMHISDNLADLNYTRYQEWEKPETENKNSKPAVTVFTGEAYKGLDVSTFSVKDFENAQKDLMILSGLYGILKPLDLMYPYRLEMGTSWNVTPKTKNLYEYWGSKLAEFINKETNEDEVIVNLASNEYFKAVDKKVLKARIITPVFKDLKGDKFKIIMMYAKHARGAMTRDIIQNQYKNVEDLKGYNVDGYSYSESLSNEDEWVFVR